MGSTTNQLKEDTTPIHLRHIVHPEQHTAAVHRVGYWQQKPSEYNQMYTGDRFQNMEVIITKGEGKAYTGIIVGSSTTSQGETIAQVKTYARAINTTLHLNVKDLREL